MTKAKKITAVAKSNPATIFFLRAAIAGDVSRAADVATIVDACIRSFGRIDILHNNVGIVEVGGAPSTCLGWVSWMRHLTMRAKNFIANPCCRFRPRPGIFGSWKLGARQQ